MEEKEKQGKAATPSEGPNSNARVSGEHAHPAPDAHGHDDGHGLSHLTPITLLLAVFGALVVFTVVTVMVTKVDLGGEGNFIVAMVIATIKAGLVMAYFMHLRWDKKFNVVVFLSSFLFVTLFLGILLTDRKEYQDVIDSFERVQAAAEAQG
jgi:cytochrome c oxidase subunit 4